MNSKWLLAVMVVTVQLWAGSVSSSAFAAGIKSTAITVEDSTGHKVTVSKSPMRIVTLAPHATELVFAAGGGDRLVAVTAHSDYPEAAKRLPVLGGYSDVSLEGIYRFKPDLVVAWPSANPPRLLKQLANLGIPVYQSQPENLAGIVADLKALGQLVNSKEGSRQASVLEQKWQQLSQRYSQRRPVPTFIEVWSNPLMTLNGRHMVSEVLRVCGARNIFDDAVVLVPRISREDVIARQPELIVEGDEHSRAETGALLKEWQAFTTVPAVRHKSVYTLEGSLLLRPSPRVVEGAREFCEKAELARSRM